MFLTFRGSDLPLYAALNPEVQGWPMVELVLNLPFFIVHMVNISREEGDDDVEIRRTLLVGDNEELEDMANYQSAVTYFRHVDVVIPAWMSKGRSWEVKRLLELQLMSWPVEGGFCFGYKVEDGTLYHEVPEDFRATAKISRVLYSEERNAKL